MSEAVCTWPCKVLNNLWIYCRLYVKAVEHANWHLILSIRAWGTYLGSSLTAWLLEPTVDQLCISTASTNWDTATNCPQPNSHPMNYCRHRWLSKTFICMKKVHSKSSESCLQTRMFSRWMPNCKAGRWETLFVGKLLKQSNSVMKSALQISEQQKHSDTNTFE